MCPGKDCIANSPNTHAWLLHGNPTGDPASSPRCGAKTRAGTPCEGPAMWSTRTGRYTRCRLHGGKSTGPRTQDGLERSKRARWSHGRYSVVRRQQRSVVRRLNRLLKLYAATTLRLFKLFDRGLINLDQMESHLLPIQSACEIMAWIWGIHPRRVRIEGE